MDPAFAYDVALRAMPEMLEAGKDAGNSLVEQRRVRIDQDRTDGENVGNMMIQETFDAVVMSYCWKRQWDILAGFLAVGGQNGKPEKAGI